MARQVVPTTRQLAVLVAVLLITIILAEVQLQAKDLLVVILQIVGLYPQVVVAQVAQVATLEEVLLAD